MGSNGTSLSSCVQVSLNNVVMELRKLCGHPYLLDGVEPHVKNQSEADRWALFVTGTRHGTSDLNFHVCGMTCFSIPRSSFGDVRTIIADGCACGSKLLDVMYFCMFLNDRLLCGLACQVFFHLVFSNPHYEVFCNVIVFLYPQKEKIIFAQIRHMALVVRFTLF